MSTIDFKVHVDYTTINTTKNQNNEIFLDVYELTQKTIDFLTKAL